MLLRIAAAFLALINFNAFADEAELESRLWKVFGETKDIDALEELEKIYYQSSQWDRFFAIALYYKENDFEFRESFYAREALALAKHCRWSESQEVLTTAKKQSKKYSELEEVSQHLKLQERFANEFKTEVTSSRPGFLFEKTPQWRVGAGSRRARSVLKNIESPKHLRVVVTSRC